MAEDPNAVGDTKEEQPRVAPALIAEDPLLQQRYRLGWIFISYEPSHRAMAEDCYHSLQRKGLRCWMRTKAPKTTTHNEDGDPLDENLVRAS